MQETIDHLLSRRSVPAVNLKLPAPDADAIGTILTAATRVPDHGKLAPWRFIIFRGDAQKLAGEKLLGLLLSRGESFEPAQEELERARLARAPLVIGVVSRATMHPKIPMWEQELSAGAVCMNMLHAVHGLGFAGQWLSEWYMFDEDAGKLLGLEEGERFAGFVHVGTPEITPTERPRPDVEALVTEWQGE
ncbi:MAG: nitroreductase [Stappiaceae bacterium]